MDGAFSAYPFSQATLFSTQRPVEHCCLAGLAAKIGEPIPAEAEVAPLGEPRKFLVGA